MSLSTFSAGTNFPHLQKSMIKFELNPNFRETVSGIEIRKISIDQYAVVATAMLPCGTIIGEFEPMAIMEYPQGLLNISYTFMKQLLLHQQSLDPDAVRKLVNQLCQMYPRERVPNSDVKSMENHLTNVMQHNLIEYGQSGRSLCYTPSFLNNCCSPNSALILDKENKRWHLVTLEPIPTNKQVTIQYCNIEDGFTRKEQLKRIYGFICTCSLCSLNLPLSYWRNYLLMQTCAFCGMFNPFGLLVCRRCKLFRYCNHECQMQHVPIHDKACSLLEKYLQSQNLDT